MQSYFLPKPICQRRRWSPCGVISGKEEEQLDKVLQLLLRHPTSSAAAAVSSRNNVFPKTAAAQRSPAGFPKPPTHSSLSLLHPPRQLLGPSCALLFLPHSLTRSRTICDHYSCGKIPPYESQRSTPVRSAWGIISYVSIWEYNDFFGQQMCLFSDDILLCKSSAVDLFGTSPHNMTYDYATYELLHATCDIEFTQSGQCFPDSS